MYEVNVAGVRVEMPTNQPIVLLKERDGARVIPIWVGAAEAAAIAYMIEGVRPPRPLTHDLLLKVVNVLDSSMTSAHVSRLSEGVFYAEIGFGGGRQVDARASDAIALALRGGVTITVADEVMEEAGVVVNDDDTDDEVERFREFIDHVTAEDFENPDNPA